jgi:hypothetical protein
VGLIPFLDDFKSRIEQPASLSSGQGVHDQHRKSGLLADKMNKMGGVYRHHLGARFPGYGRRGARSSIYNSHLAKELAGADNGQFTNFAINGFLNGDTTRQNYKKFRSELAFFEND